MEQEKKNFSKNRKEKAKNPMSMHTDHIREQKAHARLHLLYRRFQHMLVLSTFDCLRSIKRMSHQGWR